ncbi:hypothetical protein, variant 2 [Aphanomyces astaci]|uniref:Ubiquitin-like domain-containing protein n=1 Tax=Aphanomyces astaci TaxID=112090 RepID=W4GYV7_APHAT|nr:hypothetical protein, variant 1 [Aphanomyces astaci]XP_009826208.1 hypothetical protein, variant 2 [Aphanomyces astaci]ETV84515.1 hypothetical protein, variant 1 [Aphanomyces astaci]ETV84516.1 hypothetical protein, variant 2 [Aphanomyces astaci]|eukprot:XP_009826207.1 hypothetical protein, variant 1 [Aphanomyces astaci]
MGDVTRQQQRGHVLPRDVFKTLVRLEAKVDWQVSEVDMADQLHLPHSYVDPVVTLASQFNGPGPGQYDPANASTLGPHAHSASSHSTTLPTSSFSTTTRRQLLFEPQYVKPHETYREGPFSTSQSTSALPPSLWPHNKYSDPRRCKATTRPLPRRRKNSLRSTMTPLPDPPPPSPTKPINGDSVAFSFPRGHRTDLVSHSTPVGVSAATYDAQSTWTEEVEPPRVVVGFQSSVVRVPRWMPNPDVLAPADQYRKCVVVERRRQVYPQSNGDSNAHSSLDSDGHETSLQRVPGNTFDPFQWLRNQPDGLDKVKALNARLVELTTSDAPNQSRNVDAPPTTNAADFSDKGAADDCVVKPMAITVVLPAGLALTYRVPPTRSVASLKHAIAKKLTTKRSRETKDVRDDIVVPGMLTLYLKGLKLVDTNDLGGSGVQDRSSLVYVEGRRLATYYVLQHMHNAIHVQIPETAFIDDEGVMVDWYFVMQSEQVVRKKKKIQHTNVMLFELRLQELAAARGASDLAVLWDNQVELLNEAALDALVRTLCLRESNMMALNPNLSIPRKHGHGRFCLQECHAPRGNWRYVARYHQKAVNVIQTPYLRSMDITRIGQDKAPADIEAILRQNDMTVEWTFATPQGGRREVPFLIGAQRIRGTDGVVDTAKSEPFTRLKRELEDLRLPAKSDTSDVAVHPRQVVCRHCREPREVELSKELAKTHTLLRQALTNLQHSQEQLEAARVEATGLKKKVADLDVTVYELHNQLKREGSQAKSTIQSLQLQLDAQMTQVQDTQEGIAQAQVATSEMAAALAEAHRQLAQVRTSADDQISALYDELKLMEGALNDRDTPEPSQRPPAKKRHGSRRGSTSA